MNDQAQARPADAAVRTISVGVSAKPMRSPAELAAQLDRDATSLQLTADTIAPADTRFYQGAAAAMREAATWLAGHADREQQAEGLRQAAYARGLDEALCKGIEIAMSVRDPLPLGGKAQVWRDACNAILNALKAVQGDRR